MPSQTVFGDLTLTLDDANPANLLVSLTGRSTGREPARDLLPWFEKVFDRVANSPNTVTVHFERLQHFNSSTIAAIIQVIGAAESRDVQLKLVYDAALRWQALSFDALKRAMKPFEGAAPPLVTIVAAATPPA